MVGQVTVVCFGHGPADRSAILVQMKHPKAIGDRSTMAAMLALNDAGFAVSIPFGENVRYDLIIDDGQRLARVQCKTGRLRRGAVLFNVCSCYGHHLRPGDARRTYHGQVDYFAGYCPDTGGGYLIPIDDLPVSNQASLRVEPSRNRHGLEFGMLPTTRSASSPRPLKQNLARLLVREDLALHPLEGIVDRLRVAAKVFSNLLVGGTLEIEPKGVRL